MSVIEAFVIVVLVLFVAAVLAYRGFWHFYLRSEAFRNGNRFFYRAGRPTRAGRIYNGASSFFIGRGSGPTFVASLETTGHRTGRPHSIPVVLTDYNGAQYIVSMFGERSPWVRNVREERGSAVLKHGERRAVHLTEIPVGERAVVIKAFLGRAGGARPHIRLDPGASLEEFERIAPRYPVFRIDAP